MSIKTDQAIAKITEECEGKDYLIPFEEYLTSICSTDSIADKILSKEKNLEGCYSEMKSIAKKRAVNGCTFIPPEEGFSIIRKYYGIDLNRKAEPEKGKVFDIMDFM